MLHTIQELKIRQALPLDLKINMTKLRLREWVNEFGLDGVYISFSGGKDSTVLLHMARQIYPNIKAVFVDTGLEYPEIREFVKTFDNVDWIRPKLTFKQVIEKYGYPFISKEVAECVYGAKRYLTELAETGKLAKTDRQTGRQYATPSTDNEALARGSRGGYDNKYRKLRGIGEFAKKENGKPRGRSERTVADPVRETTTKIGEGDYP